MLDNDDYAGIELYSGKPYNVFKGLSVVATFSIRITTQEKSEIFLRKIVLLQQIKSHRHNL